MAPNQVVRQWGGEVPIVKCFYQYQDEKARRDVALEDANYEVRGWLV
ncbi:MAG: hypothetical protein ACE5J9_00720 [Methanosarcinales archaeon]